LPSRAAPRRTARRLPPPHPHRVAASETTLTELFGIGPIIASYLIGFTGDITRFASRDH
jgi:hypothetical protein